MYSSRQADCATFLIFKIPFLYVQNLINIQNKLENLWCYLTTVGMNTKGVFQYKENKNQRRQQDNDILLHCSS